MCLKFVYFDTRVIEAIKVQSHGDTMSQYVLGYGLKNKKKHVINSRQKLVRDPICRYSKFITFLRGNCGTKSTCDKRLFKRPIFVQPRIYCREKNWSCCFYSVALARYSYTRANFHSARYIIWISALKGLQAARPCVTRDDLHRKQQSSTKP